jgi:hypothetical protein
MTGRDVSWLHRTVIEGALTLLDAGKVPLKRDLLGERSAGEQIWTS